MGFGLGITGITKEVRETLRTGIPTNRLIDLMAREKGFEGTCTLCINIYSVPFAFWNPTAFFTGSFFLMLSSWTLAGHLHELVDLGLHEDFPAEIDHIEMQP